MKSAESIAKVAQDKAHKLGIAKFDIFGSSSDDITVKVKQGAPDQIIGAERSTLLVRVWDEQGRVGIASSTDVTEAGIESALRIAREASVFGVTEFAPDFSTECKAPLEKKSHEVCPEPSLKEMIDALCKAEKSILTSHDAIKGVPYNGTGQKTSSRYYFNSLGALRFEEKTSSYAHLYTRTEQDGRKSRSAGRAVVAPGFAKLDLERCTKEVIEKTISHLDYKKIDSGKYTVVFSPQAFLDLIRAFSNTFNAQLVLDKQSLSTTDSVGKQLASAHLRVCDDPLHAEHVGASFFDSEGTPTRKTTLIDDGILKSFLHSSGTAKRFNTTPTGNANIGSKVTVSAHFFHVSRSTSMLKQAKRELKNEASPLIYVDELNALHAGVNSMEGSFSLPFDGWIVENGKFTSIEAATVAGDFFSTLKSICYVDDREVVTPGGICPEVWVESVSVASE